MAHGNGGHGRWGHDFKMLTDLMGMKLVLKMNSKDSVVNKKKPGLTLTLQKMRK